MSDLHGGGPGATGRGNGNGPRMPQAAPVSTGSPRSGVRTPMDIMRDRQEREARRVALQEAMELERQQAEEENRLAEAQRTARRERRIAAVGAAPERHSGGVDNRSSGGNQRRSDNSQMTAERTSGGDPRSSTTQGGETTRRPTIPQPAAVPRPEPPSVRTGPSQAQTGPGAQPAPQAVGESSAPARQGTQSSFPHAFERWETLSSHWEGLTSFWIRRLQENSNEIQRDPLSSQLSRQITDLSAAGANLFHAVVELQRLRASSERKFQRWFFETRAEQERSHEMQAQLELILQQERLGRAEAIEAAVAREAEKSNSEKVVAEMKRELQISKEEARRAWEELGRREQEERERTASLREGQPTLVGGVQVVPMMQGVPSRHGSTAARPSARSYDPEPSGSDSQPSDSFNSAAPPSMPTYTSAPAVQPPSTSSAFYQQQQGTTIHATDRAGSEGTYSEGDAQEYEIEPSGHFRRDSHGRKIPYGGAVSDDDENDEPSERARQLEHLQQYGHAPVTASGSYVSAPATAPASSRSAPGYVGAAPVDYSGDDFGSGRGWEAHRHPSRLSDVLEEEERSLTGNPSRSRE